jgi:hypothetical protein
MHQDIVPYRINYKHSLWHTERYSLRGEESMITITEFTALLHPLRGHQAIQVKARHITTFTEIIAH